MSTIKSISDYNRTIIAISELVGDQNKEERKRLRKEAQEWLQQQQKAGYRYAFWDKKDFTR